MKRGYSFCNRMQLPPMAVAGTLEFGCPISNFSPSPRGAAHQPQDGLPVPASESASGLLPPASQADALSQESAMGLWRLRSRERSRKTGVGTAGLGQK